LALSFPVRGGIAFGDLYTNPAMQVFLGRGLTEAHRLEQQQEWVGIALSPSLDPILDRLVSDPRLRRVPEFLVVEYDVPMKSGSARLKTLNWRFNLVVKYGTRSLFRGDGDEAVNRKITNSLEYAGCVRSRSYIPDEGAVPVELRTLFVGDGPPPPDFTHGDEL
jgi:hypothetical protein